MWAPSLQTSDSSKMYKQRCWHFFSTCLAVFSAQAMEHRLAQTKFEWSDRSFDARRIPLVVRVSHPSQRYNPSEKTLLSDPGQHAAPSEASNKINSNKEG
jgi:hypothetical protein